MVLRLSVRFHCLPPAPTLPCSVRSFLHCGIAGWSLATHTYAGSFEYMNFFNSAILFLVGDAFKRRQADGLPSLVTHATTSRTTWPSTQEIHVAIRVRTRENSRMAPDACAHQDVVPREAHEVHVDVATSSQNTSRTDSSASCIVSAWSERTLRIRPSALS